MSSLETQILQQIAQLQSTMGTGSSSLPVFQQQQPVQTAQLPQTQQSLSLTADDVRRIARETLVEELTALKNSAVPAEQQQQTPVTPSQEVSPTLIAVNKALTDDEKAWLFQTERLAQIESILPSFLQTEDGQLAIQSFYLYYRGLQDAN